MQGAAPTDNGLHVTAGPEERWKIEGGRVYFLRSEHYEMQARTHLAMDAQLVVSMSDLKGKGSGGELLAFLGSVCRWAKKTGFVRIEAYVKPGRDAARLMKLYHRFGMQPAFYHMAMEIQ